MNKINTSSLKKLAKDILVDNCIPELTKNNINEFKIGNNFFYEIKENNEIKHIQRVINKAFQQSISLNNSAIAFRENYSYLHLFEPHRKNYFFLRLDIRSFFHSIQIEDVKEVLKEYFDDSYIDEDKTQKLLDGFINLISYKIPDNSENEKFRGKQVIPMGFITSPIISNIIFRKIDIQIQKYCANKNIVFTRYADDMLFSSDKNNNYVNSENFEKEISILIAQMNFKLNRHKTIKKEHTISLNGYTIQHSVASHALLKQLFGEEVIHEFRLSNKKIYVIKKLIHMIEQEKRTPRIVLKKLFNYKLPIGISTDKRSNFEKDQLINKVTGYRSFLLSFIVFNKKTNCMQKSTEKKYLLIIDDLNKIIEKYRQ